MSGDGTSTQPSASLSTSAKLRRSILSKGAKRPSRRIEMWYTYIIECKNGSLYTGITDNLNQRLQMHITKRGAEYTKSNRPIRILYSEPYEKKSEAAKREYQLKGWTRAKKLALAVKNFALLNRL